MGVDYIVSRWIARRTYFETFTCFIAKSGVRKVWVCDKWQAIPLESLRLVALGLFVGEVYGLRGICLYVAFFASCQLEDCTAIVAGLSFPGRSSAQNQAKRRIAFLPTR